MPENKDTFIYQYTPIGPEGQEFTATAEMKRVR